MTSELTVWSMKVSNVELSQTKEDNRQNRLLNHQFWKAVWSTISIYIEQLFELNTKSNPQLNIIF